MKFSVAWHSETADACAKLRAGRMSFELAWAAICPPLVAILVALLPDALWVTQVSTATAAKALIPLMLGGMAVLSTLIYLDCRAVETFGLRAKRVRITQGISTAITLIVLAVIVTTQAERRQISQAAEMIIFVYLPTLFTCGALLWHASTIVESSFRRALMLVGFVVTTAVVERLAARGIHRYEDEQLLMSHSLLVALAFAIQVSVWSSKRFDRR